MSKTIDKIKSESKDNNYYVSTIKQINSLIKKLEYNKALDMLVEEMSMPYIPLKYEETFSNLFREVTLLIEDKETSSKFKTILTDEEIVKALNTKDIEPIHLEVVINSLKNINIRSILKDIKKFLSDKTKNDFIKTLVLIELVRQEIKDEIILMKGGQEIIIYPSRLTPFEETKTLGYVSRILEEQMFKDQTQQMIALGIMQTSLIFEFPNEIKLDELNFFVVACHYMSSIYLRKEETLEDIMSIYKVDDINKVLEKVELIQKQLDQRETIFSQ
jgi:hypothetical protein